MASRLRTWVRRVTPPATRALARRVASDLLQKVAEGAEQITASLQPALPASTVPGRPEIQVAPPRPPQPRPKPLSEGDLGWALARHISAELDAQRAAVLGHGFSLDPYDAERLRRMRVGSRRLRSLVQLFEPWLDKKVRRRLERDLKAITAALGPPRDLDVVRQQFTHPDLERTPLRHAAAEQILARLDRGRTRTRKQTVRALQKLDANRIDRDLRETKLLLLERLTTTAAVRPALATLLGRVSERAFKKTPVPTTLSDREAVHDVRILAKRLRYAHGWVKPAMQHAPGPRRLLKRAQRAVGDSRDLDLFLARLEHHEAKLRDDGQGVLAGALEAWQHETQQRRDKADTKILPALANLSHRNIARLTHDALGLQDDDA